MRNSTIKQLVNHSFSRRQATPQERQWSRGHGGFFPDQEVNRPTRFDELVAKIGLSDKPMESLVNSAKLRQFAKKNRKKCWIPATLLRTWGLGEGDYE